MPEPAPAAYAMRAQRYMAATGAVVEDLATVSVKNHANGALNPDAQFRRPTPLDEVLGSRPVADPLTLLQCCGSGDGAAAPTTRVAAQAYAEAGIVPADLATRSARPAWPR